MDFHKAEIFLPCLSGDSLWLFRRRGVVAIQPQLIFPTETNIPMQALQSSNISLDIVYT